jgi:hypothetical protein
MSQLCVLRFCFICFDDFRTPVLRLPWKPPSTRLNIDFLHSENVIKDSLGRLFLLRIR